MEGTNTHGLQIRVKQYQGCSRAETGKSRCCPKQNLLERFNTHNTPRETGALSCEQGRTRCEPVSSWHGRTRGQGDPGGRAQALCVPSPWWSLALVFGFLWRREPATETRPGSRSRATEKHRNSSAAFPLQRPCYPQARSRTFQLVLVHGKLNTHTTHEGPRDTAGREEPPPPRPHGFDSFKDAVRLTLKSRAVSASARKPPLAFSRCQIQGFGWRPKSAVGQWNRVGDLLRSPSQRPP